MLIGLINTPAVFQSLVNDVLCDSLHRFVFVHIDDILIFSWNMQEHTRFGRIVLENHLLVKAENTNSIQGLFLSGLWAGAG